MTGAPIERMQLNRCSCRQYTRKPLGGLNHIELALATCSAHWAPHLMLQRSLSPAPTRCGWANASGGGAPFFCSGLGPPVSRLKRWQKLPPLLGMVQSVLEADLY